VNLILLGAPGAGKGTQAEAIAKKYRLFHVSTGDLFRAALKDGKELGNKAKEYMERGELVPDEIVLQIVAQNLPDNVGFLFDGFPRNVNQAKILDHMLETMNKSVDAVINIQVDEPTLVKRLLGRGRSDDNQETILNRLMVYEEQTSPLINYYEDKGNLFRINGNQSVEQVTEQISDNISMVQKTTEWK
jgi:adenylate kinase